MTLLNHFELRSLYLGCCWGSLIASYYCTFIL